MHQKDLPAALAWFEKGLQVQPRNADVLQGKGSVLIEMGRTEEGVAVLSELLEAHPERTAVREFLQNLKRR